MVQKEVKSVSFPQTTHEPAAHPYHSCPCCPPPPHRVHIHCVLLCILCCRQPRPSRVLHGPHVHFQRWWGCSRRQRAGVEHHPRLLPLPVVQHQVLAEDQHTAAGSCRQARGVCGGGTAEKKGGLRGMACFEVPRCSFDGGRQPPSAPQADRAEQQLPCPD